MIYWKFRVLLDTDGKGYVHKWMDNLDAETYQKVDALIKRMKAIKIWSRPYFDIVQGYPKLHAIIVKGGDNVPHRIIGCFRPRVRREFVLLIGGIKKNGTYTPRNLFKIAARRAKLISEKGRLDEY